MTDLAIEPSLSVPPMFGACPVDAEQDPFSVAVQAAQGGAAPGALFWTPRPDRADCAVVLGPENTLQESLCVAYVAMNAGGDALGALMPAGIPLVFGWPDRIIVNGFTAGGIRVAWPDKTATDAVPDWMVAGVRVQVAPDIRADADATQTTNLLAEGCTEITVREILESFSRYFLYWIDRWLDEGFAPVKAAWLSRAANYGPNRNMELGSPWAERELLSLEPNGDISYAEAGRTHTGHLGDALTDPAWRAAP